MPCNKPIYAEGEGRMPAIAPLANPYVPYQVDKPATYETPKAIIRGTLFPGLDLPFMGMVNKDELQVTPLTELQAMYFVLQELILYLDTHKEDIDALDMYRTYQRMYNEGVKKYEESYGPLNHLSVVNGEYKWLEEPWPWEYARNREV